MAQLTKNQKYWRSNLIIVGILLAVWFLFSCVLSIWFVEELNQFKLAGFPLGFWIAQQGSIIVFVILVFIYAFTLQRLDRKYGVDEKDPS